MRKLQDYSSNNYKLSSQNISKSSGFTLIEIVIVIAIIGSMTALLGNSFGAFSFFREDKFISELKERIQFLHHHAVYEQVPYQIEFNFDTKTYRIGALRSESDVNQNISESAGIDNIGSLSLELLDFLNPYTGDGETMIPPPSYPSLAEPISFPGGAEIVDITTASGKQLSSEGGKVYIQFLPQGFTDFAVIHMKLNNGSFITILVNPFTGEAKIQKEYKDYEWKFNKKQ